MINFEELNAQMAPLDADALARSRAQWNSIAKPLGGLGVFEGMIEKIAGLTGDEDVRLDKRVVTVMCADNGVVCEGVSQSQPDVTTAVASNVARGVSSVCMMAHAMNIDGVAVDVGMLVPPEDEGVIDYSVARGTMDIYKGPAMTAEQACQAIQAGIDTVRDLKAQGYDIIATGEMSIANTTTSSAMTAVLLNMPVEQVTGRGAGLSDAGLSRKKEVIAEAIRVNQPNPDDAFDVLVKLGGFDICGMVGEFLGGALYRVPIIVDGFISALAAYVASKLCPNCTCCMLGSHVSAEPAAIMLLERIGCNASIHGGMHLGEGTGAVMLVPLLDMTLGLYRGTTFDATGIDAYEVLS